jgi:hypothetical protein
MLKEIVHIVITVPYIIKEVLTNSASEFFFFFYLDGLGCGAYSHSELINSEIINLTGSWYDSLDR